MKIENGFREYPDDFFEMWRFVPGSGAGLIKQGKAKRVQGQDAAEEYFTKQGFFVAEMVVNRGQIYLRRFGDLAQRHPMISPPGKQPLGRIEYALFGGKGIADYFLNETNV